MSFIKHSIQTIGVRVFSMVLMFLVGVITARTLGPEGDGILALLILLKNLCLRFGNLGMGSAFVYMLARRPNCLRRFIRLAWLLSVLVIGLGISVLLLIWRMDFSPWKDIEPMLFYLSFPMIFFFFINNYFQRILSGQLRISEMNIADLLAGVCNLSLLLLFTVGLSWGLVGGVAAFVISDGIVFVYLLSRIYRRLPAAESGCEPVATGAPVSVAQLWQYGGWSYLAMLTNFLVEEIPLIFLKLFVSSNIQVGLFHKARTLGRQSRLVALPVSQVLFPYTANSQEAASVNRTNTLCRNSILVMGVLIGLSAMLIKPIILFLYGEAFLPSAAIFYGLAIGVIVWPCSNFLGVHIAAAGRPKLLSLLSVASLVIAAAVYWPVISRCGTAGIGWGISTVYVVQLILRLAGYLHITKTSLWQVLIPQRHDLKYYFRLVWLPGHIKNNRGGRE